MPFNAPIHAARSPRVPSPGASAASSHPGLPQRNPSTASNASHTSNSTTASSTSSLEAAPIKPPPIQTRTAVSGAGRGDGAGRQDTVEGEGGVDRVRSREDKSRSPTTPRMGWSGEHGGETRSFARGPGAEVGGSTITTSTGMGMGTVPNVSSYQTRQATPVNARHRPRLGLDFPAHLLPSELRPSSSGPDLASLRQRAADERRERSRSVAARGPEGGHSRPALAGPSARPFSAGDLDPAQDQDAPSLAPPTAPGSVDRGPPRAKARTRSSSAQVTQVVHRGAASASASTSATGTSTPVSGEARKTVSLADFDFGEMLGRGSYSTVRVLLAPL